jgi:hypothetical protein
MDAVGNIYSGMASFGQIMAVIKAVVVSLLSIGLVGYGIYILWVNWDYSEDKAGIILEDSTCQTTQMSNGKSYQTCQTKFSFKDQAGNAYTATASTMVAYKKGDTVTVFYKESDPANTCKLDFWPKSIGWLFIAGGILFAGLSWAWVYLVDRFKPLAAFSGGANVVDLARAL